MFLADKYKVIEFKELTRTVVEAASALGCEVAQIAKSIIFKTAENKAILVVASGINRIDEALIESELGEKIFKADADFVRGQTGYVIGGVPPWGHLNKIETYIDMDLDRFERIWAAAGKNNAVFELTFEELVKETGGRVMKIKTPLVLLQAQDHLPLKKGE
ncbi:MAG: YbaK/EbsC family protein [Microgenomates group bacterium]